MRSFYLVLACVMLGGLAGCAAAAKPDLTPVTSSSLPGMQKYNSYIGKDYWVIVGVLQLCEGPTSLQCSEFLQRGTHLKVDGLVPNHSEVGSTSIDDQYFHVIMDDGRSGFVDGTLLPIGTTTVDPKVAAAECKKKGEPKLGMNAAQVSATCWGPPNDVNTKIRKTGKYEQYVYGDNKFVYLRDGYRDINFREGPPPQSISIHALSDRHWEQGFANKFNSARWRSARRGLLRTRAFTPRSILAVGKFRSAQSLMPP